MLRWRPITTAEFPHSDTHGSMLAYSSPWLFAVNRVLHRLLMPRHSPYALISLIFSRIGSNNLSRLHEFSFSLHPLKLQQSDITTLLLSFDLMFFLFLREFTSLCSFQGTLVGSSGLEPPTSRLSGVRSNQLSYRPLTSSESIIHLKEQSFLQN